MVILAGWVFLMSEVPLQVFGHLGRMALMDGASKVLIIEELKSGEVRPRISLGGMQEFGSAHTFVLDIDHFWREVTGFPYTSPKVVRGLALMDGASKVLIIEKSGEVRFPPHLIRDKLTDLYGN